MLSPALMVLVFLLVLSPQREKTNMHTVLNIFISASFFTVFVSYLSSQASSSLVFGIKFFLCVCMRFFFFFLPECFYWTTSFFFCLYIFI